MLKGPLGCDDSGIKKLHIFLERLSSDNTFPLYHEIRNRALCGDTKMLIKHPNLVQGIYQYFCPQNTWDEKSYKETLALINEYFSRLDAIYGVSLIWGDKINTEIYNDSNITIEWKTEPEGAKFELGLMLYEISYTLRFQRFIIKSLNNPKSKIYKNIKYARALKETLYIHPHKSYLTFKFDLLEYGMKIIADKEQITFDWS